MKKRRQGRNHDILSSIHLQMNEFEPLNKNQAIMFNSENNIVAHGSAGTGKTFLATLLAVKMIFQAREMDRVLFIRSAVPTRDLGFLKGSDKEKVEVYETPYKDILAEIFNRGDAYDILKAKGYLEFMSTSFIRGTTINNTVLIVDECQNMSYHELDSVITRVGKNCRVFFCGDMLQADLEKNGIKDFFSVLKAMNEFDFIEFGMDDIVRSDFVKNYLISKQQILGTT